MTSTSDRPDAGPVVLTASMAQSLLEWLEVYHKPVSTVRDAIQALASGQTVCVPAGDAAIGEVVWRFIDRMKDVSPPEDSAERILSEFVAAVQPAIDRAIDAFKPKDARSNAVRAAALLIAEIERLDRADAARTAAQEKEKP